MDKGDQRARLEGWKEIAGYVGRTVRTVQRWEQSEGLPIHRHQHQSLGSVYAQPEELDRWIAGRRESASNGFAESEPAVVAAPPPPEVRKPRRWIRAGTSAAALAVIASAIWLTAWRPHATKPVWLLVTDLDNRSGEPLLDRTVPYLLEREISNTKSLYVASRNRVEDALRLMRRSPDTKLDEAVAREVSLRDGEIRLILSSRAERTGATYLLTASLIDSATGRLLGAHSEQVPNLDGIARVVRRLAYAARDAAGEGISPADTSEMQPVTTPSLRACQLFSQAYRESTRARWPLCEQFAREALAEDPQFASAHLWLAWALFNQNKRDEARSHLEQALALKDGGTDRERQFILLSQKIMEQKFQEAELVGRRMVESYPDDYFALANLSGALMRLGRLEEAVPFVLRRANLQPNSPPAQQTAFNLSRNRNPRDAHKFAERLGRIAAADPASVPVQTAVAARRFPLHEMWLAGNLEELRQKLDRQSTTDKAQFERLNTLSFYQTLGRLRDAEARSGGLPSPWREEWAVRIAHLRDDPSAVSRAISADPKEQEAILREDNGMGPFLWIQKESSEKAVSSLMGLVDPVHNRIYRALMECRYATLRGDFGMATRQLDKAKSWDVDRAWQLWQTMQTALARAYEQAGDVPAALRVLENADNGPVPNYAGASTAAYWHRNRYERARYLRKLGRAREAEEIEAGLRKDLRLADPDHPIVVRLGEAERRPFQVY